MVGGGGFPGTSPYDVADLSLAYDLLQPNSAVYDGSNRVATLVNFSGVANCDAVQASDGLKPIYEPAGLNGRPSIRSDGVDDYMTPGSGALALTNNIAGWTDIFVGHWISTPAQVQTLASISNGLASNNIRVDIRTSATPVIQILSRRLDADSAVTSSFDAPVTTIQVRTFQRDYANALARVYSSGSLVSSVAAGTAGNTSATNSIASNMFANNANGLCANYRLGARFAWPRILTTAERVAVEKRLGYLWGIPIA